MRAVQLTAYGNPIEGLKYVDLPEPDAPGPNQVLIGVEFSPLNQSDLLLARGIYGRALRFPLSSAMKVSAAFCRGSGSEERQGRRPRPGAAFQLHLAGANGHSGERPFRAAC